jgi:hypothetical protein
MPFLTQALAYSGFLRGLPHFLRSPISVETATAAIRQRLARREETFVRFTQDVLLAAPRSPYRQLFRLAGCDSRELPTLVRDSGVEGALLALRRAGVYVGYEEFKGRAPIVRNGQDIPTEPADFINPFLSAAYTVSTSGSTGIPRHSRMSLDHLAIQAEHRLVGLAAHGLAGAPSALWRPILPAGSGLNTVLRAARSGEPPQRWFTPNTDHQLRGAWQYRAATTTAVAVGRLCGSRLPWPEPVAFDDAGRIARWMAGERDQHGRVWLNTTVSNGVRVAEAAQAEAIDLTGATFMIAGEPVTAAKVQRIRASGASFFSDYGMSETGRVAIGCACPKVESDLHVLSDAYAIIGWMKVVPHSDECVSSFHVTALSERSPSLLLNVEFDDDGTIEQARCGCPLESLGLRTHLRDVRSYGKLTGEGMTLVGSAVVRILEEMLPARCGGSPLDYQLIEEEDDRAFTRLTLIASPRITASDEMLREAVLSSLTSAGGAADFARALWQQAGTLRVRRAEPYVSDRGKQASFRSAQFGRPAETA